jgi:hypothetical protein
MKILQLIPSYSQNPADRSSSPKAKMTVNLQQQSQQQIKMFVNNSGPNAAAENAKRNNQNKVMFNKNVNSTMTNASSTQKNVTTTGTLRHCERYKTAESC